MTLTPIRAFDFHRADVEEITAALADCANPDDLTDHSRLEVSEDTSEDAPFDIEPDQVFCAEQDV